MNNTITERKDADGKTIFSETSSAQQSSVEISRNAKGDMSFSVKVYADKPDDADAMLAKFVEIAKKHTGQ